MKKFNSFLLVIITLLLISVAAAAITYAIRDNVTLNQVDNTFSNGDIKAVMTETKWDNVKVDGGSAGNNVDDLGKTKAKLYALGDVIPKNPAVYNMSNTTTTDISDYSLLEWVGIKAEYYVYVTNLDGSESVYRYNGTQFNCSIACFCADAAGSTEGMDSNWEANSDGTEFYYTNKLSPAKSPDYNTSTTELFQSVKVRNYAAAGVQDSELPYLVTVDANGRYQIPVYSAAGASPSSATVPTGKVRSYSLPQFDINLKVYAVQVNPDSEEYGSDVEAKLHTVMNYSTTAPTSGS